MWTFFSSSSLVAGSTPSRCAPCDVCEMHSMPKKLCWRFTHKTPARRAGHCAQHSAITLHKHSHSMPNLTCVFCLPPFHHCAQWGAAGAMSEAPTSGHLVYCHFQSTTHRAPSPWPPSSTSNKAIAFNTALGATVSHASRSAMEPFSGSCTAQ